MLPHGLIRINIKIRSIIIVIHLTPFSSIKYSNTYSKIYIYHSLGTINFILCTSICIQYMFSWPICLWIDIFISSTSCICRGQIDRHVQIAYNIGEGDRWLRVINIPAAISACEKPSRSRPRGRRNAKISPALSAQLDHDLSQKPANTHSARGWRNGPWWHPSASYR